MKTTVLLMLCLTMLLGACKKSQTNNPQPSFAGTWELRATKGGNILPATFPPGNGHLIILSYASYTYSVGGSVVTQGNFQAHTDLVTNTIDYSFFTGNFTDDLGTLKGDTLRISPLNPDATSGYYVKE